jgi:predicted nucleic acid-binding protein
VSPRKTVVEWVYFDTSVLVKRYVREEGSRRARELLRRHRLLSCAIAPLEALCAFSRRRAAGELSAHSFGAIMSRLRADRGHWELVEVNASLLGRAEAVIAKAEVRTLDALHIASALAFQELLGLRVPFVTADERQWDAAQQMGLQVMSISSTSR